MIQVKTWTKEALMSEREYDFPVFGTQGGGLAKETAPDVYVFVEAPDCPGLDVGDTVPEEWGIVPANSQARDNINQEEFSL